MRVNALPPPLPGHASPLATLDAQRLFPGRTTLRVHDVAKVMGCTPRHIADLCSEGVITAVNVQGLGSRLNAWRIPVGAFDAWIKAASNLNAT